MFDVLVSKDEETGVESEMGICICNGTCESAYKLGAEVPFKCNSPEHGVTYEKFSKEEDFQSQTKSLVDAIMLKRDGIDEEFHKLDLDNDLVLSPEEAQPMLTNLDVLKQRVQALKQVRTREHTFCCSCPSLANQGFGFCF